MVRPCNSRLLGEGPSTKSLIPAAIGDGRSAGPVGWHRAKTRSPPGWSEVGIFRSSRWFVDDLSELSGRRQADRVTVLNPKRDRFPTTMTRAAVPGKRGNEHGSLGHRHRDAGQPLRIAIEGTADRLEACRPRFARVTMTRRQPLNHNCPFPENKFLSQCSKLRPKFGMGQPSWLWSNKVPSSSQDLGALLLMIHSDTCKLLLTYEYSSCP